MSSAFMLTYGAVFAAELVGDKLLYRTRTLAARYRVPSVPAGVTVAIAVTMGAAVLIGAAIAAIPRLRRAGRGGSPRAPDIDAIRQE